MSNFIAISFMNRELFKNVTKILNPLCVITAVATDFFVELILEIPTSVTVASNANSPMPKYVHCNMHHEEKLGRY